MWAFSILSEQSAAGLCLVALVNAFRQNEKLRALLIEGMIFVSRKGAKAQRARV